MMRKAADIVERNNGLSCSFGGGKVISGVVAIFSLLEEASALDSYVEAVREGNTRKMDDLVNNIVGNMPDVGTIGKSAIWEDVYKANEAMKQYVYEEKNK